MKPYSLLALFVATLALAPSSAQAFGKPKPKPTPSPRPSAPPISTTEPAFCTPANFYRTEFAINTSGLDRAYAFKVGKLTLVGLAVGSSGKQAMVDLAQLLSDPNARAGANEKYCTWYFNDGKPEYTRFFNWKYLDFPDGDIAPMVELYDRDMGPVLTRSTNSFLECSERNKYLAFGCDGMEHRGPTAFAMLLSYVGCSPRNAVEIAVKYWGRNTITDEMRRAIATRAQEMSDRDPVARQRLRDLMMAP